MISKVMKMLIGLVVLSGPDGNVTWITTPVISASVSAVITSLTSDLGKLRHNPSLLLCRRPVIIDCMNTPQQSESIRLCGSDAICWTISLSTVCPPTGALVSFAIELCYLVKHEVVMRVSSFVNIVKILTILGITVMPKGIGTNTFFRVAFFHGWVYLPVLKVSSSRGKANPDRTIFEPLSPQLEQTHTKRGLNLAPQASGLGNHYS